MNAKTILITGANRGIGLETARQLADAGHQIIVGVRNADKLQPTIDQLVKFGVDAEQVSGVQIDLNDSASITAAGKTIADQHPDLGVLINNAGISGDMQKPALETTIPEYQETLNVNLFGTMRVTEAMLPVLLKNRGQIVNLTGPFSATKWYNPAAYRVSKIALNAWIETLAVDIENQKLPISILGIFPGGVSTDINNHRQGPYMKTTEDAAGLILRILKDGKRHNGDIIGPDGTVISKVE